jgi:o-succinylbenzoate synthase
MAVLVDRVELRVVRLPRRTPFVTSYAVETEKVFVLATVSADGVEGYGEGVMDPLPMYREESIAGALHLLREALIPSIIGPTIEHPSQVSAMWAHWRGNPMAKATLEQAVWDCWARAEGVSLSEALGVPTPVDAIPVGASLGIAEVAKTVESVGAHLDAGYRRIKLKIKPGADVAVLDAVRTRYPTAPLTVDANSAYTLDDAALLASFDRYTLGYIEQPLHWDDLVEHADLAGKIATSICLDESLTSASRTAEALRLGSCRVVNVKAGRVGGLTEAQRIHQLCLDQSVALWCGGMFESGIGRAHNIHLATLPGFTLPGDTASASRTYVRDIVEQPLETVDGMMPVPPGAGAGVTLDRGFLEEVTEHVEVHR